MPKRIEHYDKIYQTGQSVPTTGSYALVGAVRNKTILREFATGEKFPCYEGWEVCWHWIGQNRKQKVM